MKIDPEEAERRAREAIQKHRAEVERARELTNDIIELLNGIEDEDVRAALWRTTIAHLTIATDVETEWKVLTLEEEKLRLVLGRITAIAVMQTLRSPGQGAN
ncbi:MAG: hypothetical protein DRO39_07810 [Thermoprotei archaeon]|nr:MAG: hypothetical protein DRO39_07810 [Thermoprotei archaeon]